MLSRPDKRKAAGVEPDNILSRRRTAGAIGGNARRQRRGAAGGCTSCRPAGPRLSGEAFFAPGMLPGTDIGDFRAAWPMILAQVMGPVLLAIGFLVRPVALLMLDSDAAGAVARSASRRASISGHALFGWYVVHGAGPLSLDRVLAKGLANSPAAGPSGDRSFRLGQSGGRPNLFCSACGYGWRQHSLGRWWRRQCCRLWHPGCCRCPWLRSARHCWRWVWSRLLWLQVFSPWDPA